MKDDRLLRAAIGISSCWERYNGMPSLNGANANYLAITSACTIDIKFFYTEIVGLRFGGVDFDLLGESKILLVVLPILLGGDKCKYSNEARLDPVCTLLISWSH